MVGNRKIAHVDVLVRKGKQAGDEEYGWERRLRV